MFPPEPTIFVSDPISQTEVENTKDTPKTRLTEFAIVIDPPSDFRLQYFCNLVNREMYHTMDPEFKHSFTDPFLTFLANSRSEPKFEPLAGTNNPWLKSKAKKIK
jgi:hypothetical protein